MQIMPFGEVATIVQLPWALMKISATAAGVRQAQGDRALAEILAEHADDVRAFATGAFAWPAPSLAWHAHQPLDLPAVLRPPIPGGAQP